MTSITEGGLTFHFPDEWETTKYDEWGFYNYHFQKIGGAKATDIAAIEPSSSERVCWLIEIKDYSRHSRQKLTDLADEVAVKARDTLAGFAAARINANDEAEKQFAAKALRCLRARIVLHLEEPAHSPAPRLDRADVQQRLRQLVKAIDPHPLVVDRTTPKKIGWTVTSP